MSYWLIPPILLPLLAGSLLLLPLAKRWRRGLSLLAAPALIPLSLLLTHTATSGDLSVYALGNWAAPFGIVLMLDRLAALIPLATAVLGSAALIYVLRGDDCLGKHFRALFQFQLLGINGAFLTGDLFNLFVFFEILLIASYALLLHGGGVERVRSGLHYVIPNLVGSAFFLIVVGTLYGLTGTLNMADMAQEIAMVDVGRTPLLATAEFLLLVVFALKAALLPLYFWLPRACAAASAPAAALFAVMTKVDIYPVLRVYTLVFGKAADKLANLAQAWLWPLALATLGLGAIGVLAARTLQGLLAYLVVVSAETLLASAALGGERVLAASLYYLLHSTWIAGDLFLLAGLVVRQRGDKTGDLVQGPALQNPRLFGGAFFIGVIAVAGLPPLSRFFGKIILLQSVAPGSQALALWSVVLGSGLVALVALSRAGSTLFWRTRYTVLGSAGLDHGRLFACILLLSAGPLLVFAAKPLLAYVQAIAAQLHDLDLYHQIVTRGGAA